MRSTGKVVIISIVMLLIGGLAGYMLASNDNDETNNPGQTTEDGSAEASQLRHDLNALLREHAALTVPALKARLLEQPDADELGEAVDMNSVAIAEEVDSIYEGTRDDFLTLWREHIGYYEEYLQAARQEDQAAMDEAKDNLTGFAERTSQFFKDHNPEFDQEALRQSIATHGEQVTAIIDDLMAQNYTEAYELTHQAYEHMGMIADQLAAGIAEQFPDRY